MRQLGDEADAVDALVRAGDPAGAGRLIDALLEARGFETALLHYCTPDLTPENALLLARRRPDGPATCPAAPLR